jgi:hypothetical protein
MDNFFTGSHANIAHHFGKPNFELIRHDIVEPILLEARARTAGRGGPGHSQPGHFVPRGARATAAVCRPRVPPASVSVL